MTNYKPIFRNSLKGVDYMTTELNKKVRIRYLLDEEGRKKAF